MNSLKYKNSTIHFEEFGRGGEWLFAFHGFGESREQWAVLTPSLGGQYTVLALDLPYHGDTAWRENHYPRPEDLGAIIGAICERKGIDSFSVLGYSMGGKFAIWTAASFSRQVKEVLLVAPDGLHRDPWQEFAVGNPLGRKLFQAFIDHPGPVFRLMDLLKWLRLMHPYQHNFIQKQMATRRLRDLGFTIWNTMKAFDVDLAIFKNRMEERKIPVLLIYGKRDYLIPQKDILRFARQMPNLVLLPQEKGHHLITEDLNPVLEEYLKPE